MANLAYLGTRFLSQHHNPFVSPWYAPNLDRFPPVYLSVGADDAVLPDSLTMTQRFAELGVNTTLSVVPGYDHEYLLHPRTLPGIAAEWERIFAWLREHTGSPA
jgi:acetyl esterase/lipase